jgi:hypothetical protein
MGSGSRVPYFVTSALDGGEWSASRPYRFTAPPTHWLTGWVSLRDCLNAVGEHRNISSHRNRTTAVWPVARRYADWTVTTIIKKNCICLYPIYTLPRDGVNKDQVLVGNWIYWALTHLSTRKRNYSTIANSHTLQLSTSRTKSSQSAVCSPMSSISVLTFTTNFLLFWLPSQDCADL